MLLTSRARVVTAALATGLLLALTACDGGSGARSEPEYLDLTGDTSLAHLVADSPPARALDETREARERWLAKRARVVAEKLDAELEVARDGTPRARPATTYLRASATEPPRTRFIARDHTSSTHDSSNGPVTTTADHQTSIEDQTSTARTTYETTVGTPPQPTGRTRLETTTTTDLCPPDGEITGEWSTAQVVELPKGGIQVRMAMRGHGTFRRTADGRMSIADLTMTGTASGNGTSTDPIQVSGSVGQWTDDYDGDILKPAKLTQTGGEPDRELAYALPALMLLNLKGMLEAASRDAAERRESGGVCVRLEATADTGSLGVGDSATITVKVTDPTSGEEIPGAEVEASPIHGDAPRRTPAPGSLTFTATGDEPSVVLSVETDRGGDAVTIRFDVPGWRFAGVSYKAVTAVFRIPTVTTWEGEVCGDPFTEPWQLRIVVESPQTTANLGGEMVAHDVANPPGGDRAWLLIQAVEAPAPGRPPFRLWIDDTDPAAAPSHQRVEITTLEPVEGACVG